MYAYNPKNFKPHINFSYSPKYKFLYKKKTFNSDEDHNWGSANKDFQ